MKIEAKKSKYSVDKNIKTRPAKSTEGEPAPEKPSRAVPEMKAPKINIPKVKLPHIALPKIQLPKLRIPKLRFPKFKIPKLRIPKFQGKWSVYVIVPLVIVPVLIISAWLGMNMIRRSVPKPLYTENDLPKAPPAEINGYAYIYDNATAGEYSTKDISDNNLFRNAASIEFFLDKTRGEYAFAKTLSEREDVIKMMDLVGDIMNKSTFADMAMPIDPDSQKVRAYMALHNSITATLIARMQEKKYGAAFKLMKDQLNLNIQYMRSARSMNDYLTSMHSYEKSLDIMKSMLNQFSGEKRMGNDAIAASREIGDIIRSFNPQSITLTNIVMFEYILLWKRTFDPSIQHPETSTYQRMKYKALAFFDRGGTQRLFDERWKKIYECAKNPAGDIITEIQKIQEQRFAAGRFWWFNNAVGKKHLDSIGMPIYQLFHESKNMTATVIRKQGDIIAVVSSLKDEPKQEKKQAAKKIKKPLKKKVIRKPQA
jgi:hypothetical protein